MPRLALSVSLSWLLCIALASGAKAISFADGLTHTVDSAYVSVEVSDGPGPSTTTVHVEDGAAVLAQFTATDSSVVNINGGMVGGMGFDGGSTLSMSGGAVGGRLFLHGSSSADIGGGEISHLDPRGLSTVNISGGVLSTLWTGDNSTVTMSGGTFSRYEPGHLERRVQAYDSSTIVMVGAGFEVDGIPVPYGDVTALSGTLTGTLLSGESFHAEFRQGGGFHTGTITLVPEPTTALLLGIGLGGLALRRRLSA